MTEPANRYAIVVFWSDEDDAWVADVPDLKSCSAFGGTREEAVVEIGVQSRRGSLLRAMPD